MSRALADVANLEGGIAPELVLDREVPLVVDGRLNVGIPEVKNGASEAGIVCAAACSEASAECRRWWSNRAGLRCCKGVELSWSKRGVLGQAQVGAGALKIRRDGERAANDGARSKERRAVGKTNARLEVPSTVEAIVERAAGTILVGEFDRASSHVVVGLLVVNFNPGSKSLVT